MKKSKYYSGGPTVCIKSGAPTFITEKQFKDLLDLPRHDPKWSHISLIQHYISPKPDGLIAIDFYAQLNEFRLKQEIEYSLSCFEKDVVLKNHNFKRLCLKHSTKIAYFIKELFGLEVLKMRLVFSVNKYNTPYLVDAKSILVRNIYSYDKIYELPSEINLRDARSKKHLRKELETHFAMRIKSNVQSIEVLSAKMRNQYLHIKSMSGIENELEDTPNDDKSEKAFREIMPHSPYSLENLLSDNFDPKVKLFTSIIVIRSDTRSVIHAKGNS